MSEDRRCVRLPKDSPSLSLLDDDSFEKLPPEMLSKIISYLEFDTRQSVRLVCKRWHFLISAMYQILLQLDSQNWNILSKCCAKYIALDIRGVPVAFLTEAELTLNVVPLCDRLTHLEFGGIVSYENIRNAIITCHHLVMLNFYKIEFDKKRQTAIASKSRSGIYFQANETHTSLLPKLVMLEFILIGRDPDELHLLHFLSAIVKKGGLQFFKFVIFHEIPFNFGQIECLLGNPPVRSPTTSALNLSGSEFGEVLEYDACVEKIISSSIGTLERIFLKIKGKHLRKLSAKFVPELRPIPKFTKFEFHENSLLLHNFNAPWLHALKSQSELTKLELDIFFNEVPENGVSSFQLIKEIIASNAQSLTTIYLNCDFPEFRDPIRPQWDCRTFSACTNLETLTLHHWRSWLGNFNQLHLCPKLIGLEYLPPNVKTLSTALAILLPGESLTEFHFTNLQKLEELEMLSIPWFLTSDGSFERLNRNGYNHLLHELPKLKIISGTVKEYFDVANGQLREVSTLSMDLMETFGKHIRKCEDINASVICMKIVRNEFEN